MTQGNEIVVMTNVPTLLVLFCGILSGSHLVVAKDYLIGSGIGKTNR